MTISNPHKFWRPLCPRSISKSIELSDKHSVSSSTKNCPTKMNNCFTSIFATEDTVSVVTVSSPGCREINQILISSRGTSNIVETFSLSSCSGSNNISSKTLKGTKDILSELLCLIFSQSLLLSFIPNDWKLGKSYARS